MAARPEARARAQGRLEALRRRASHLRRRVVAGALAVFIAAWVGILIQMASGNDPVLGSGASSGGEDAKPPRTQQQLIQTDEGTAVVRPASPTPSRASPPAPVTTSQS
jgi:hypothetical protein